ncbi:hypothetical protein JYU34_008953 [Plutella xylostella]|uniref:Uncharacterized protein n=1 Tax=Plutella xylostella TaxID=51655 RepID=A0ABQ7QMC3_PLUXY|nr:hypothetical protein JYU34_008953 [Plutella xylostella]
MLHSVIRKRDATMAERGGSETAVAPGEVVSELMHSLEAHTVFGRSGKSLHKVHGLVMVRWVSVNGRRRWHWRALGATDGWAGLQEARLRAAVAMATPPAVFVIKYPVFFSQLTKV